MSLWLTPTPDHSLKGGEKKEDASFSPPCPFGRGLISFSPPLRAGSYLVLPALEGGVGGGCQLHILYSPNLMQNT
jgi:hypothetical protein